MGIGFRPAIPAHLAEAAARLMPIGLCTAIADAWHHSLQNAQKENANGLRVGNDLPCRTPD